MSHDVDTPQTSAPTASGDNDPAIPRIPAPRKPSIVGRIFPDPDEPIPYTLTVTDDFAGGLSPRGHAALNRLTTEIAWAER